MVIVSTALLSIGLVGIWFATSATSQENALALSPKKAEVRIINNVPGLVVIRSREDGERFLVTVKNTLDKTINGFYTTSGDVGYQIDLVYSDRLNGVSPSMEFDVAADLDDNLRKHGLTIRAVLFESANGAGEESFVRQMREKRDGEKAELIRGHVLLNRFLAKGSLRGTDLTGIRDTYAAQDSQMENESTKAGMHAGKDRFLHHLDMIRSNAEKDKSFDLETELRSLDAKLQEFTSKL